MDRLKCCTSFAYCFLNGPTAAPSAAVFEEEDQSTDLSDAAVSLNFTYNFSSDRCLNNIFNIIGDELLLNFGAKFQG